MEKKETLRDTRFVAGRRMDDFEVGGMKGALRRTHSSWKGNRSEERSESKAGRRYYPDTRRPMQCSTAESG